MNTQPLGHGRDDDPTGVRDLLAALPEPGPMPEELLLRITTSLAREQVTREQSADAPPPTATDELARRRTLRVQRRTRVILLASVAAAAVVAISVGYVSVGGRSAPVTAQTTTAPNTAAGPSSAAPVAGIRVIASGHDYGKDSLGTDAKMLENGQRLTDQGVWDRRSDARAARERPVSLLPCVKGLAKDLLDRPEALTVDFATFQGRDAMIIVVKRQGRSTVWAVGPSCSVSHADVLAGPQRLDA